MNACIILFGGSFRLGGQGNRNIGSSESYSEQIKAAQSHMSFIKDLNSKNVKVDVYISSYQSRFQEDLAKVYETVLIGRDFYPQMMGQNNLIYSAMSKISNIGKYDFLLVMRVDMCLKSKFTEIFNHQWDKILWPSICFKPHHKVGVHPRVNDAMLFIPRQYYKYLQVICATYGHNQWADLHGNTDLKYDDMDTMLNTFHDSDSAKDFNPIYYIVNRKECTTQATVNEYFDKWTI